MSILAQLGTKRTSKHNREDKLQASKAYNGNNLNTEEENLYDRDDDSKLEELSPTFARGPIFSKQKISSPVLSEKQEEKRIRMKGNSFFKSDINEIRLIKMSSCGSDKEYPILSMDTQQQQNYSSPKNSQKQIYHHQYNNSECNQLQNNYSNDDEMRTDFRDEKLQESKESEIRQESHSHPFKMKSEIQKLNQNKQKEESTDSIAEDINYKLTVPQVEVEESVVHPDFIKFDQTIKKAEGRKIYKKIINHSCIHLEGYQVEGSILKELLRKQRLSLQKINIIECCLKKKSRIEAVQQLFLQDDLQVGDFPLLKEITIDFLETENDIKRDNSKQIKNKLQSVLIQTNTKKILRARLIYQKTIEEIQKEFQVVKKMEYCIQCEGQVMVINQLPFQDKKAFFYIKRHLAAKLEVIRCVVFINIANLRKNSLKLIFENLREVTNLQEINFINTIINRDSLILIRNILTWFSAELRSIKFIQNELNENDLQLLFLDKNHLHISDLYNLEELLIQKNPQATNSSSYHDIMKIFKRQIEIAIEGREKAICLPLFSSVTYLSSRPHFKLFPFDLQPRQYCLNFNDDHQFESYSDELDELMLDMLFRIQYTDFCQKLDLSQVSFLGADPGMINLLAEVICDSKSVQVVYLKNNYQVLQMLEEKILKKNEYGLKNKLNPQLIQLNKTFLEFKILGSQSNIFKNKNMKSIANLAFFVNNFTIDFQGTSLQQDALLGLITGLTNSRLALEVIGKKQGCTKYLDFSNQILVPPYLKSFTIQNISNLEDIQPVDFKNFITEFFTLFGCTLESFLLENIELEYIYIEEIERGLKIAFSELEKIGLPQYALKKFGLSRSGKQSVEFDELYLMIYKQFPQLQSIRFQQNQYIPRTKQQNLTYDISLPRITTLDLSGVKFKKGYCLWQKVFQVFFSQPSIIEMNVSSSNFDISCVEEFLVEFLQAREKCKLFGLKNINLSKTDLSNVSLLMDRLALDASVFAINQQNQYINSSVAHNLNHSLIFNSKNAQNLEVSKPGKIKVRSSLFFQSPLQESQEIKTQTQIKNKKIPKETTLFYHFFDSLFNFTKIRSLNLSDCQLCSEGLSIICNRIKYSANIQTSLRYINISGNTAAACKKIISFSSQTLQLFIIFITHNFLFINKQNIAKLDTFLEMIFDFLADVEEIYIRDFGDISNHLQKIYMQIVRKKKRLDCFKILDLSGTYFVPQTEEQIGDLATVLFELIINCQELNISKGITSSILAQRISEKLFYEMLNHSKNVYRLESINLSCNPLISSKCWKMLIKSLMLNFSHTLSSLDISYCSLNSEKITNILEAIEESQKEVKNQSMPMMKLSTFTMKGNHELSEEKQAGSIWQNIIFRLLSQKQINLTVIHLDDNQIDDQIAECLLRGLKQANAKTLSDPIDKCIYTLKNITFDENLISRKMLVSLKNNFLLQFCNNISIQNIEVRPYLQENMQLLRNNRNELTQKIKFRAPLDLENTKQKCLQKFILGEQCASSIEGCADILKNIIMSFNVIETLEVYIKFPQKILHLWHDPDLKNMMTVYDPTNCKVKNLILRIVEGTEIIESKWGYLLSGFFKLSNQIQGVYLEKVGLTGKSLKLIVNEMIDNLQSIQIFSIADNPRLSENKELTGESLKLLLKSTNKDLRVLSLRNCNLCVQVVEIMCLAFDGQQMESLEQLDLSQNKQINPQGWYLLFYNFFYYSRLIDLNISQCLINNNSLNFIIKALNELIILKSQFSLNKLNLSNNSSIYVDMWSQFFPIIFNSFGQVLERLDLSYCSLDGAKTTAFLNALKTYRDGQMSMALIDFNFSGNHFKQKEVWALFFNEILRIQGIQKLNLQDCDFEDKQITEITNSIYDMEIQTTLEELNLTNCSGSSMYYYDSLKKKYKTSFIKSIFGLSNQLFLYLKILHLENCIQTRQSARNFLQTFIDLSNAGIKSQYLEEIYLSGNKISGQVWSKLIPLIFEYQPQIKVLGIDREIKLNKEDYSEQEYLDGIAKGFEGIEQTDLRLETIIFSDHRRNRQESWYNLLNVILNEKRVYKTIKHILVRSIENFVHESAFFLAFSELINNSNLQSESTMTKSFSLFEKDKAQAQHHSNLHSSKNQKQMKKQLASIQTIAYTDKSLQTYIMPSHFLSQLLKGIVSCIENGQIMVEKNETQYRDSFWKDTQEQNIKIMVRPWHSIMKFQGGINENDFQKKTELYSALNDIRKLLSIGKEDLILDFDFDYRKFPLFSVKNPLSFHPYNMNEVNLEEIFGDISNLFFDYPLYCFLVECCSIYPGENINEFFVKFTQTFANKGDNYFQKIQTTPNLSLTSEDKDLIQNALSMRHTSSSSTSTGPSSSQTKLKPENNTNNNITNNNIQGTQGSNESPQIKSNNSPTKKNQNGQQTQGNNIESSIKLNQILCQFGQQKRSQHQNLSRRKSQAVEMSYGQKSIFTKIFKKRAPLNVLCPYFFDAEKVSNQQDEVQILERLEYMPASNLKVKNMSISALKSIYSSCYKNPYFTACEMDYPFLTFVNVSLAYSMREGIYESHRPAARYPFSSPINKLTWKITNALVSLDSFFEFDENTIVLNEFLEEHQILRRTLICLFFIYLLICFFCPYPLTQYDDLLEKKGRGISWKSHIVYGVFAIVTMIYEIYLVSIIIQQTNHLVPGIRLGGQPDCPTRFMDYLKTKLMNIQIFGYKNLLYIIQLLLSQQNRFDQYSDICFLIVLQQHQRYDLQMIWAIILVCNYFLIFNKIFSFIKEQNKSIKSQHYYINNYFEIASLGNFNAFADLLDVISPCNTSVVKSNFLTRIFTPNLCGKAINNRMIRTIQDGLIENIPQLLVQMFFFAQSTSNLDITAVLSFTSSIFSLILTIFKLLTIGQSIITQLDFDNLSMMKQSEMKQVMENFRDNESRMIDQIKKICARQQTSKGLSNGLDQEVDSPGNNDSEQNPKQVKASNGIGSKIKKFFVKRTPTLSHQQTPNQNKQLQQINEEKEIVMPQLKI